MISSPTWYGLQTLPDPGAVRWQIGPLTVQIDLGGKELRIARRWGDDPLDDRSTRQELPPNAPPLEGAEVDRLRADDQNFTFMPRLADRPVIARPEARLTLPDKGSVQVYVSTPLWLVIATGGTRAAARSSSLEIPIARPSDTWFGPSTREGELAYASRTRMRAGFWGALPKWPHRAFTSVNINNNTGADLLVDRLRLPVHQLALYQSKDGGIWTQEISLDARDEPGLARVHVREGAPGVAHGGRLLATPRVPMENDIVRAFNSFVATLWG